MIRIETEYGSHSCGEGGEFETMVLGIPFFTEGDSHYRGAIVEASTDRFASGHLKINKVQVEKKGRNVDRNNDGKEKSLKM